MLLGNYITLNDHSKSIVSVTIARSPTTGPRALQLSRHSQLSVSEYSVFGYEETVMIF